MICIVVPNEAHLTNEANLTDGNICGINGAAAVIPESEEKKKTLLQKRT